MPLDVEKALRDYQQVGEWIKTHNKALGDCKKIRQRIRDKLRRYLYEIDKPSCKTHSGYTIYTETVVTPTGADWDAFFKWIKEHDAFDALEQKIKRSFITEYMDKHNGGIPPGVSVFREKVAKVRKTPTRSKLDG